MSNNYKRNYEPVKNNRQENVPKIDEVTMMFKNFANIFRKAFSRLYMILNNI